jgi:hypothetical protein
VGWMKWVVRQASVMRGRRLVALALVSALALAGVACGPAPPDGDFPSEPVNTCIDEAPPADGKEVTILGRSEGQGPFWPLDSGESLLIYHGPQGGQHVYVSIKWFSSLVKKWEHHLEVIDASSGERAGGTSAAAEACAPGWSITSDVAVFLDYEDITEGTIKLDTANAPDAGSDVLHVERAVQFHE